jgi:hypothetical protein
MDEHRFRLELTEDIEDPELARLDDEAEGMEKLFGSLGRGGTAPEAVDLEDGEAECPFEMGVAQPRAISLFKLYELMGQEPPHEVVAALGRARTPVLIVHQMTPFSQFGYPPTRVWGMGYQIHELPEKVLPLDFAPKSEFQEIVSAGGDLSVRFRGDGSFEVQPGLAELARAVPGLGIDGLACAVSADGKAAFSFRFTIELLKIAAGIVARGVRWDFIARDDRIERSTRMLQTVLVPHGLKEVDMKVRTWVRRRRFLGRGAARSWLTPLKPLTVDVEQ